MKTKLIPITSLDQLEVGSIIVDENNEKRKILGKVDFVVFVSLCADHEKLAFSATIKDLQKDIYQLEVPDEKWKPKDGEKFYLIYSPEFYVMEVTYVKGDDLYGRAIDIENCFRTYKEAQAMTEKFRKLLAE